MADQAPTSALRSTISGLGKDGKLPVEEADEETKALQTQLSQALKGLADSYHHFAAKSAVQDLARRILACFPLRAGQSAESRMGARRALQALRIWERDGRVKNLVANVERAVDGNEDLMEVFGRLLQPDVVVGRSGPLEEERRGTKRKVPPWEGSEPVKLPYGWVGGRERAL
jgi:hypothetical protein